MAAITLERIEYEVVDHDVLVVVQLLAPKTHYTLDFR